MDNTKTKIEFYKTRTFSDKMNITFDFLRENWKPLLKFSVYLILPICLIQAFAMNSYTRLAFSPNSYMGGDAGGYLLSFLQSVGLFMIVFVFGCCVLYALVFTVMIKYEQNNGQIMNITLNEIKPLLIKNFFKMMRLFLFSVLIFIVLSFVISLFIGLSVAISQWLLIFTIPVTLFFIFFISIPLCLFQPVYIFEDISLFSALRKSFKYGISFWGSTFVIVLVFTLLASIVSGVAGIPWTIIIFLESMLTITDQSLGTEPSIMFQFLSYIFGIIQSYGIYLSYIISAIAIAFHYFHIKEKKEGVTVNINIQNFERL